VTALRNEKHESIGHNYSTPEKQLIIQLQKSQDLVHAALCDSFNTPQVMLEIRNLISSANIYYADKQKHKALPNTDVMFKIARYVTKMMRVFGVFEEQDPIGSFGQQNQSSTDLLPILNTMSEFRDTIRKLAQENKDKTVLEVCDKFRDIDMVDHGVVLVDREGTKALVKLVDKKVLAEQKLEMKLKNDQVQTLKNERKQKELEVQELRRKKAEILPGEMFKTEEFSEWDDEGVPVMMKDGEEVSKSRRKKLVKEYEAQVKLYKEFH
jgi:cysteinyl-tRNA synthetase